MPGIPRTWRIRAAVVVGVAAVGSAITAWFTTFGRDVDLTFYVVGAQAIPILVLAHLVQVRATGDQVSQLAKEATGYTEEIYEALRKIEELRPQAEAHGIDVPDTSETDHAARARRTVELYRLSRGFLRDVIVAALSIGFVGEAVALAAIASQQSTTLMFFGVALPIVWLFVSLGTWEIGSLSWIAIEPPPFEGD